jgi:hypothetical protein
MNKKISVKNLTNVDTFFRCVERPFDAKVPKKNSALFTIGEILAQVYAGNPDFVGTDRKGSHASLYITDRDVRIETGFESADGKTVQEVVDEKAIIELFKTDKLDVFAENLKTKVLTIGEKQTLSDVLDSGKVNEHDKIEIAGKFLRNEPIEGAKAKSGKQPKKAENE